MVVESIKAARNDSGREGRRSIGDGSVHLSCHSLLVCVCTRRTEMKSAVPE